MLVCHFFQEFFSPQINKLKDLDKFIVEYDKNERQAQININDINNKNIIRYKNHINNMGKIPADLSSLVYAKNKS